MSVRERYDRHLAKFCSIDRVLAIARRKGRPEDFSDKLEQLIQDELNILSSSQLGFGRRSHNAAPTLSVSRTIPKTERLLLNVTKYSWTQGGALSGRHDALVLDDRWREFARRVFFDNALRVLRGKVGVKSSWRETIRSALILVGQSQATFDINMAFLWNMIALEMLLTNQGDKVKDELPNRIAAFIGWAADWASDSYSARIAEIYKKRNVFVHQGRSAITIEDVVFSDELLLNVLANVVGNTTMFSSKDDVIAFSKRVEAAGILGITKRVLPKSLKYYRKGSTTHRWK
jgi:hypothetical protein